MYFARPIAGERDRHMEERAGLVDGNILNQRERLYYQTDKDRRFLTEIDARRRK